MTQEEYLEILFNDCGFDRQTRRLWLAEEFGRSIRYTDEMSISEKSAAITLLKKIKEELS